jgi:hypothetical protein
LPADAACFFALAGMLGGGRRNYLYFSDHNSINKGEAGRGTTDRDESERLEVEPQSAAMCKSLLVPVMAIISMTGCFASSNNASSIGIGIIFSVIGFLFSR